MKNVYAYPLIECYMCNTKLNSVNDFISTAQMVNWLYENKNNPIGIDVELYRAKCKEFKVKDFS